MYMYNIVYTERDIPYPTYTGVYFMYIHIYIYIYKMSCYTRRVRGMLTLCITPCM